MKRTLRPIWWEGPSKNEPSSFPGEAIQDAGYQLHRLQEGNEPQDWKLLKGLGKGVTAVYEIRIRGDDATFRVAYVTGFVGYVTVLHRWQKSTQTTAKVNRETIAMRRRGSNESADNHRQRL